MVSAELANLEVFATILAVGLATVLSVVSFLTYQRLRRKRILMIGWAFIVFALKGLYLVYQAFESRGDSGWVLPVAGFDVLILLSLYLAVRVR